MENNKKPEWFELADNDQPVTRQFKGKVAAPKRNIALILAGVLVLPMGAGWALLSHEDQSANAVETLNLTQDSPVASSATPAQTSDAITMPTASREDDNESESESEGDDDSYRAAPAFSVSSSAPVATPAATQSSQPASVALVTKAPAVITPPGSSSKDLILPPTKKSGDDDDEKEHKKKSEGKESKKSENDDDEEDDD
jgi:hypothetical protein